MKLPRYLQIALALTVAVSLWSQFSDPPDPLTQEELLPPRDEKKAVSSTAVAKPAPADNPRDLFPFQGPVARQAVTTTAPSSVVVPVEPSAPALPFKLVGAWWSHKQRYLVLSDGNRQWIICRQCGIAEGISSGEKLDDNWQLRAIEPDHLVFRWLPLENDQRLSLGDMQSKPEF